jgi:alpha-D-xyloside xylohydrolase
MKFDEGHWRLLPGTEGVYPLTVVEAVAENGALTVTGLCGRVQGRWSYLDTPSITARFTSPLPGVIRVQITHHKGRREKLPVFDLDCSLANEAAVSGSDDNTAWLDAGGFKVVAPKSGDWRFDFVRDGEIVTASEPKAVGLFRQNGKTYLREQLSLGPAEAVYGLGERFSAFVKNGQAVDVWNMDGGTDSELAYKSVPFYVTSAGYGVLVNHPGNVSFEVASHHVGRVQFSAEGHSLDYYVFGGPTMKDALTQYTALSGRPPALPDWSFDLWLSTSFTTNYNEEDIFANIERMEEMGIPVGVFHFDCFWMKELTWTSFIWDERNFPDPAGMLKRIKDKGIKVCVWINPYIAEAAPTFDEAAANGYLLKSPDGGVYQEDNWQAGIGFVDFTNPAACEWYAGHLRTLLDMGVDSFKTDFGERIPTAVVYHDGSDPERMHNYYTYLYNKAVFDLLREYHGEGGAVVFARSATAGGQKFPVHWGGDNSSSYTSMAETLRGGLSLGLSGFGYWSHDIGGFNDAPTPDLYKRWVAFGLLSSHSRLHGNGAVKTPWLFGDEAVDVLRYFVKLKTHIMPYLLDVAWEAQENGWPMLRAMAFEYPDDRNCRPLDMQYMMGPALLVAPVFSEKGDVQYYLPPGEWRNLLTGETATGGVWRCETHGYLSLPLWVSVERGGAWDCLKGFSG